MNSPLQCRYRVMNCRNSCGLAMPESAACACASAPPAPSLLLEVISNATARLVSVSMPQIFHCVVPPTPTSVSAM